jgi:hypothetical protein
MLEFAPIVLFTFNRPKHLKATVEALLKCPEAKKSCLVIYCDGPRNSLDWNDVSEVRKYSEKITGFNNVEIIMKDINYGLSKSVIAGVTEQLSFHDKAIILEDDLIVSPYFLKYMNEALSLYASDNNVASIHGYMYPVVSKLPSTFFLRGADCWGWATWANRWVSFEKNGSYLLKELKEQKLIYEFDMDGAYLYSRMLQDQISGRNDSWAVRWHASCFLKGLLTLYPNASLVFNAGNDSSGTNTGINYDYDVDISTEPIAIERISLSESKLAKLAIIDFFRRKKSFRNRLKRYICNKISIELLKKYHADH